MSIHSQIFQAIESDPGAVRAVADAVVAGDAAALRGALSARGVELSDADAAALLTEARGGAQAGSACTCTCTCT